jgi:preprotein translocase subunit SecA
MSGLFDIGLSWNKTERTDLDRTTLQKKLEEIVADRYARREEANGAEQMRYIERMILLQMVDTLWKEHLLNMDHLKEGIGLRGYGQKNPLDEYKKEGFNMFRSMIETVKQQTVSALFRVQVMGKDEIERLEEERRREREEELKKVSKTSGGTTVAPERQPIRRDEAKIGRNSPCPCGSGKKHKKCCGSIR